MVCEGHGIIYSDADPEYCNYCKEGRKLRFFAWFREAKAEVVKAKTV